MDENSGRIRDDGFYREEKRRPQNYGRFVRLRIGPLITLILTVIAFMKFPPLNPLISSGYNTYFSRPVLKTISSITDRTRVNIAEILIIFIILLFVFRIISMIKGFIRGNFNLFKRFINFFTVTMSIIITLFIFIWGFNYRMSPAEMRLGLKNQKADINMLVASADYLIGELNEDIKNMDSEKPKITDSLNNEAAEESIYRSFSKLASSNATFSSELRALKPLFLGKYISYTGTEGFFMPLTGESSYNPDCHPLLKYYVMYHELAHAYGFAGEDETGAVTYIASRNEEDPRIRYSATAVTLLGLMDELKSKSNNEWEKMREKFPATFREDLKSYSEYVDSRKGKPEEVFTEISDRYLKLTGNEEGQDSYSRTGGYIYSYLKNMKKVQ